jgi:hypothetical protein
MVEQRRRMAAAESPGRCQFLRGGNVMDVTVALDAAAGAATAFAR